MPRKKKRWEMKGFCFQKIVKIDIRTVTKDYQTAQSWKPFVSRICTNFSQCAWMGKRELLPKKKRHNLLINFSQRSGWFVSNYEAIKIFEVMEKLEMFLHTLFGYYVINLKENFQKPGATKASFHVHLFVFMIPSSWVVNFMFLLCDEKL